MDVPRTDPVDHLLFGDPLFHRPVDEGVTERTEIENTARHTQRALREVRDYEGGV